MARKGIDYSGRQYGKLQVLTRGPGVRRKSSSRIDYYWICQCDCGNTKDIRGSNLTGKNINSCGCLQEDSRHRLYKTTEEALIKAIRTSTRGGARKRNLPFELSLEDVGKLIFKACVYCGVGPSTLHVFKALREPAKYNGIDRIDSSLGYTTSNAVTCCYQCNVAKHDHKLEDFKAWVKRIYEFQNKK